MEACNCKNPAECMGHIKSLMSNITSAAEELERLINSTPSEVRAHTLFRAKPCAQRQGLGELFVPNGGDDFDKDVCMACKGTGRVVANN